jgi:hypothetical protein
VHHGQVAGRIGMHHQSEHLLAVVTTSRGST